MQVGVVDASSDINGVIAAIGLDVGIGEGIADLKAVFTLTTEERRLDSWTSEANRIVVLVAVQLDAGESKGIEFKTVSAFSTKQSGTSSNAGDLEFAKNVSLPSPPTRDELAYCEPMLSAPVPALINWSASDPIRVSPVSDPEIVLLRVAIRD